MTIIGEAWVGGTAGATATVHTGSCPPTTATVTGRGVGIGLVLPTLEVDASDEQDEAAEATSEEGAVVAGAAVTASWGRTCRALSCAVASTTVMGLDVHEVAISAAMTLPGAVGGPVLMKEPVYDDAIEAWLPTEDSEAREPDEVSAARRAARARLRCWSSGK